MRILLISDIHANAAALQAVTEPYDVCLCMGDLVEYGPDPAAAVAWTRQNATWCVRGNHDHGTAQNVDVSGIGGFRYLTQATRRPTIDMLSAADRKFLGDLPTSEYFTLDGKRFLMVHASPRDPLDEYVPADAAAWAARLTGVTADYVCVGHTHQPFALDVGTTKVINPGSLGLQRDGDPRARYAILDDDKLEFRQVAYDYEETVRAVQAAPFEMKAKQLLAEVYRTGKYAHTTNGVRPSLPNGVRATA